MPWETRLLSCGERGTLISAVGLSYTGPAYRKEVLRLPDPIKISSAERQRAELLIDRLEQRLGGCEPVHIQEIVRGVRFAATSEQNLP